MKSFRLRTLLILVAAFAVSLAGYLKLQKSPILAGEHYCNSLDSAYRAVALHIRDSVPERDRLSFRCEYDEWIPIVTLDRDTLTKTRNLWEQSINSTAKKDHYWRIYKKPWLLLTPEPQRICLPALPVQDSELQSWWNRNLRSYIATNQLHHDVNTSFFVGDNTDIFSTSVATTRKQTRRFFALDDLLPNETATTQGKNQ